MPDTTTHSGAVVPSSDLTGVSDKTDVATETTVEKTTAEKILNVVERTSGNPVDPIIVLEDWAHESWSDYDIASHGIMTATKIEDYSEKAYKLQGAHEVQMDVLDSKTVEQVDGTQPLSLIAEVDNTDEDFHNDRGETFLPKSAVEAILVVE